MISPPECTIQPSCHLTYTVKICQSVRALKHTQLLGRIINICTSIFLHLDHSARRTEPLAHNDVINYYERLVFLESDIQTAFSSSSLCAAHNLKRKTKIYLTIRGSMYVPSYFPSEPSVILTPIDFCLWNSLTLEQIALRMLFLSARFFRGKNECGFSSQQLGGHEINGHICSEFLKCGNLQ